MRKPILSSIISIINDTIVSSNPRLMTHVLLDSSEANYSDPMAHAIEVLSRNLCFKLHCRRSILMSIRNAKVERKSKLRL